MNIVILSGGSGNDALVNGLEKLFGKNKDFNINVIVNAYDNGKSTGVCRAITDTLGVSDIRKNHSRMYKAVHGSENVNPKLMEFYSGRYNFTPGDELKEISELLKSWDMEEYIPYAERFFALPKAQNYQFKDFSVSNIIYAQMYKEIGYEKTNKHFCDKMNIDDFVVLNSFDNVYLKAKTQSGKIIEDEGETVFWNNPNDKIIGSVYDVENASYGINPKAVKLVENADLILISTGTFWSSIQPTIEYLDFYKYINASKASKIWVMNNDEDGDSWGVTSLEFVKFMEDTGLNLDDFKIIVNKDASEGMKLTDDKHNFVIKSMGNTKGKHDPKLFAKAILEIYFGLDKDFDKIIFDFDDTIFSRSLAKADVDMSVQNVKEINDFLSQKAIIISGNSYSSINDKLKTVYADLKDFNVPIWADANSTLFVHGKMVEKLKELELSDKALDVINKLVKENHLEDKVSFVGEGKPVNIKIKPLTEDQRTQLKKSLESKSEGLFSASITGKTTLDLLSPNNNKEMLYKHLQLAKANTLFVGDEVSAGNDAVIGKLCDQYIEVKGVGETHIVLKLLEDKQ